MVEYQNAEIRNRLAEDTKVSPSSSLPSNISNSIQPVLIANPNWYSNKLVEIREFSTGTTIYTTSTKKETYVTAMALNVEKEAASTADNVYIKVTVNGKELEPLALSFTSGTAGSGSTSISLPFPLKIDKNTGIIVAPNAANNISINASVFLIEVDTQ